MKRNFPGRLSPAVLLTCAVSIPALAKSSVIVGLNPNPTTGTVTVEHGEGATALVLRDMTGKAVGTYRLSAGRRTVLNFSALPPGLLAYSITLREGKKAVGKISILR